MSFVETERALKAQPHERGAELLNLDEDQWFDRKSARIDARQVANLLVGFANAEGGILVIGLWDGQVEGTDSMKGKVSSWQQAALDFTEPKVPCRTHLVECLNDRGNPDHLFVIEVQTSDQVHANKKDEVYLRVGDENRRLTFAQRQELVFDKGQAAYESTETEATMEDVHTELLASYAQAVKAPDAARLLDARGLRKGGKLTIAGLLLFGAYPQTWLPEAHVRVLRYSGTERGAGARQQLIDEVRHEGPIPQQLAEAKESIYQHLPTRQALTRAGRFEKVGIVPQDAWLEGVVNAVVHRSYSVAGDHIRVEIFDDRIEIESPGRFPGIVDLRDPLEVPRFSRNPRIARVCADLHFGQELGEGIRRMFEEMRLAGLADPEYHQTAGSVRLVLFSTPIDRELEARLPHDARTLLRHIREAGRASTGELVEISGRSRPIVRQHLAALEDAGIVEWVGHSAKDPRAYWKLRIQ